MVPARAANSAGATPEGEDSRGGAGCGDAAGLVCQVRGSMPCVRGPVATEEGSCVVVVTGACGTVGCERTAAEEVMAWFGAPGEAGRAT